MITRKDTDGISFRSTVFGGAHALRIAALIGIVFVVLSIDNPRVGIFNESNTINRFGLVEAFVSSTIRVVVSGTIGGAVALAVASLWIASRPLKPNIILSAALVLAITPPPIWLTMAILLFGLGEVTVIIALVVSCLFLSVAVVTVELMKIDNRQWFMAAQFGMGWSSRLLYVVRPYSQSMADLVFRIAYVVSWIAVIHAESSGVRSGLGAILLFGRQLYDWDLVGIGWALIVVGATVTDSAVFAVSLIFRATGLSGR